MTTRAARVRVAGATDVAALTSLVRAFRDHLGSPRPPDAEVEGLVSAALADRSTELALAESETGEPLGYVSYRDFVSIWASGREAHVEDLFVVESARGAGLGRRLLELALERAAARGARSIGLHTNENNVGARAFYRASGFAPVAEPRWDGGHETFWRRDLAGPGS